MVILIVLAVVAPLGLAASVRVLHKAPVSPPAQNGSPVGRERGMNTERHVIGFDTTARRAGRWGRWGSVWGVLVGAFWFIPALTAALTTMGVPGDAVIRDAESVEVHLGDVAPVM